jgi:hypothetical protein
MNSVFSQLLIALLLTGVGVGCQREATIAADDDTNPDPPSNRIDIPPTVQRNLGITFTSAERRQISKTQRLPGAFELQPLALKEYRLILPGVIQFKVDHLQQVRRGDVLYELRSVKWLEIQARVQSAEATLQQKKSMLAAAEQRVKTLQQSNFKRADLESRLTELNTEVVRQEIELEEAIQHATRILNLCIGSDNDNAWTPERLMQLVEENGVSKPYYSIIEKIEIRATDPGQVESLGVADGAFATEGDLILRVVDNENVRFRAVGLQSDLAKYQPGQSVQIVPFQSQDNDINEAIEATLGIGTEANPKRRTMVLYGFPDELKSWSRPGVSAFMEIVTDSSGGWTLAIPKSAIVKDGLTHVFFKRDPLNPNRAIRVEADMGVNDGRWMEIKSDIGPNDEVILHGAYELKLATETSGVSQKGGHFHADGSHHEDH